VSDRETAVEVARMSAILEQLVPEVKQTNRTLLGKNGEDGLVGRVSTLESSEYRRVWHVRMLWGVVMSAGARLFHAHWG